MMMNSCCSVTMDQQLPMVGFRFVPTDIELINFFLRNKVNGTSVPTFPSTPIVDDDRQIFGCKQQPWEVFEEDNPYWNTHQITDNNKITKSIYAFTKLVPVSDTTTTKNYYHRRHVKRTAGSGTWVCKSKKNPIRLPSNQLVIGNKAYFHFRFKDDKDQAKFEDKGKWMLHEFSLHDQETDWVLCKITVESDSRDEVVVDEDITRKRKFTSDLQDVGGSASYNHDDDVVVDEDITRKRKFTSDLQDVVGGGSSPEKFRIVELEKIVQPQLTVPCMPVMPLYLNTYVDQQQTIAWQEAQQTQVNDFPATPAATVTSSAGSDSERPFVEFPSPRSNSHATETQFPETWRNDFNHTMASIKQKHGFIDMDCILETEHMRKSTMFAIWGLLKDLQEKKLDEIDMNSLQGYYKVARDAEKLNIKMEWLLNRLDEIKDAISSRDELNLLQAQKDQQVKEREANEEELRTLHTRFKEMENRMTGKDIIIEELDGEINSLASKHEHLRTRPLLDGLV